MTFSKLRTLHASPLLVLGLAAGLAWGRDDAAASKDKVPAAKLTTEAVLPTPPLKLIVATVFMLAFLLFSSEDFLTSGLHPSTGCRRLGICAARFPAD